MSGVAFKGLRIQEDASEGLTNIESSFGDIKSGRVMPGMASSERTGRAKRRIHRVPQFDVAITDLKMEENLSRLLVTAQFHTHLTALLSTLPA